MQVHQFCDQHHSLQIWLKKALESTISQEKRLSQFTGNQYVDRLELEIERVRTLNTRVSLLIMPSLIFSNQKMRTFS